MIYKVQIKEPLSFPALQRVRAGVVVTKAEGYEGELTDDQLEAIQADDYLTVEAVTGSEGGSEEARPATRAQKAVAKK